MIELSNLQCSGYDTNSVCLSDDEIQTLVEQISNWQVTKQDKTTIKQLQRLFKFNDYLSALEFTNQIAQMAQQQDHHPEILLTWGKVTVSWWTHKVKGLHKNDFICAAKCEQIYSSLN